MAKLDRLTRSVPDLRRLVEEYFAKDKWALLSVGEQIDTRSAAGRLVLNVLGSVSQWEREAIAERTAAALRHKASQGEYIGGSVPFGFRLAADGEHIEPNPAEQAVLTEARALKAAGLSLRSIGARLHARGLSTRSGKSFAPFQVSRLLREARCA